MKQIMSEQSGVDMLLKLFLLIVTLCYPVSSYSKFYVENFCRHGTSPGPHHITVGATGRNSSGILKATESMFYSNGVNCSIDLLVPSGYGIVISLRYLELRNSVRSLAGIECQDYLQFVSGSSTFTECGPRVNDFSESRSFRFFNNATVKFHTSSSILGTTSGFQLTFTSVRETYAPGTCNETEFQCNNNLCIWMGLTCDGHNNCGDKSDERSRGMSNCGYPSYRFSMRGFFLSILSILFVMIALTYICRRYRKNAYVATVLSGQAPASNAFYANPGSYGTYGCAAQTMPPNSQPFQPPYPMPQPPPQSYPPYMPPPSNGAPPPPYTQKAAP